MATKARTRQAPSRSSAGDVSSGSPDRKFEWIAAALSGCLFVALVIYLAVLGFASEPDFADFEIMKSRPYDRGGTTHIDVAVRNTGSKSAADVHVVARRDGEQVSEIVFDYLPSGSTRQGTIRLAGMDGPADLDIAVVAYREP